MEYTQADRDRVGSELRKKGILFALIAACILAGLIVLLSLRLQLWTSVLTIVAGVPFIFFWSVYLSPPLRYRKMLKEMDKGQQRVSTGFFLRTEAPVTRDAVEFTPFYVESEHDGEMAERRLYWDAQKPMPEFAPGEELELTTYGQTIKRARRIGAE